MKKCLLIAPLVFGVALSACGEDPLEGDTCPGPEILPHLSPVFLGELYPPDPDTAPDPGTNERTPFEWVLLLQSPCDQPVKINKVCLLGDPARGGEDVAQFTLEGPRPDTASQLTEAALRLTYQRQQPAADIDGDGLPDPDSVAVVVQSNAVNLPTLVVPVCARVLPDGAQRQGVTCAPPITLEEAVCP